MEYWVTLFLVEPGNLESAPKKAFLGRKPALVYLEERGRKENFVCPFVASGRFWIFVRQGYSRSTVEMESGSQEAWLEWCWKLARASSAVFYSLTVMGEKGSLFILSLLERTKMVQKEIRLETKESISHLWMLCIPAEAWGVSSFQGWLEH